MNVAFKFAVSGILFLLTLASGIWLSHAGKPLNTVIFTIHKLIALGTVIAVAAQIYQALKNADIRVVLIVLLVVAGLSVVALFTTGAMMSIGSPAYGALLIVHQVAPLLAVLSVAAAIYLLNAGGSHLSQGV